MFCHILLPICFLILTNLCNGQLNEDGEIAKKQVIEPNNKQPSSQPPANPPSSPSFCKFSVQPNGSENCPLIQDNGQPEFSTWKFGTGEISGWIGGPSEDASGSTNASGYMFADIKVSTCQKNSAIMTTKLLPKTEAIGKCLSFKYAIDGYNLGEFGVVMKVKSSLQTCQNNPSTSFRFLWSTTDTTLGKWITKQITYSSYYEYTLEFIAIHSQNQIISQYSSYVAIDNLEISNGYCGNDCNFNKDSCGWQVSQQTALNWRICNTNRNEINEPSGGDTSSGGMICISGEWQRTKVGDKTRLISGEISHVELPKCMKFLMFLTAGQTVVIRILKEDDAGVQKELWSRLSKKEDFGWNRYQFTLSDKNLTTNLKVIVEVEIVQPYLGVLGIDEITFENHNCPIVEPPNTDNVKFDCTFDMNTCGWKMEQPKVRDKTITTSMVSRVSGNQDRPKGHTPNPSSKADSYIIFDFDNYKHAARDSGLLVSPIFTGPNDDYCFSFWFLVYKHIDTIKKFGSLSLIMVVGEKEVILWKLISIHNTKWAKAQVPIKATEPYHLIFKATKGCIECGVIAIDDISFYSHKCNTLPERAESSPLDCDFSNDLCKYTSKPHGINSGWQVITEYSNNPISSQIADHTFDASSGSSVYIHGGYALALHLVAHDIWRLTSPGISSTTTKCVSFFFMRIKPYNGAVLELWRVSTVEGYNYLWNSNMKSFNTEEENTWIYVQKEVSPRKSRETIEIWMTHGGWAIDDIKLQDGACESK